MQINIGHKIAFTLAGFMLFIGYLAFRAFQQNVDLVAPDYYQQEVEYQQTINKKKNTAALSENPKIEVKNNSVFIQFPKDFENQIIAGNIHFFNPTNKDFDLKEKFETTGNLEFPKSKLQSGNHTVKLTWTANNKDYYFENLVVI